MRVADVTSETPISSPQVAGVAVEAHRIEFLDVLRGFALLGILLSHLPSFSGYDYLAPDAAAALDTIGWDQTLSRLVDGLIDSKFVSLFSLLFGIGFAIQMKSVSRASQASLQRLRRRLTALFVFGLAHAFLLWQGDILIFYALLGFLLLPIYRWRTERLVWFGVICLLLPILIYLFALVLYHVMPSLFGSGGGGYDARLQEINLVFATGTYADVLSANFDFWKMKLLWIVYQGRLFLIFGMFLIGVAIGRSGWLYDLREFRQSIASWFLVFLVIGLVGNFAVLFSDQTQGSYAPSASGVLDTMVVVIARPSLTFAYAAGLYLLWLTKANEILTSVFAPVGRMALSVYLSQTVICVALFYGYGLGLKNTLSHLESLLAALVIFAVQVLVCRAWLTHFRFGPLEWIWRQITYARRMPLRKSEV